MGVPSEQRQQRATEHATAVRPPLSTLGRKSDGTGALATRAIHHAREQESEAAGVHLSVRVTHQSLPHNNATMLCLLAGGIEAESNLIKKKMPKATAGSIPAAEWRHTNSKITRP